MKIETATAILNWEDDADSEHFAEIREAFQTGKSRWEAQYASIYQDMRDQSYWKISWSRGLTEIQDDGNQNISVNQVFPHEETVVVFKREPAQTPSPASAANQRDN